MSTRSNIAVDKDDGSIIRVYCHFDGYINEGVGQILHNYYNDKDSATSLVSKGDISELGTDEEHTKFYKDRGFSWGHTQEDWSSIKPKPSASEYSMMNELRGDLFIEYLYYFATCEHIPEGQWYVSESKFLDTAEMEINAYHSSLHYWTKFIPLEAFFTEKD